MEEAQKTHFNILWRENKPIDGCKLLGYYSCKSWPQDGRVLLCTFTPIDPDPNMIQLYDNNYMKQSALMSVVNWAFENIGAESYKKFKYFEAEVCRSTNELLLKLNEPPHASQAVLELYNTIYITLLHLYINLCHPIKDEGLNSGIVMVKEPWLLDCPNQTPCELEKNDSCEPFSREPPTNLYKLYYEDEEDPKGHPISREASPIESKNHEEYDESWIVSEGEGCDDTDNGGSDNMEDDQDSVDSEFDEVTWSQLRKDILLSTISFTETMAQLDRLTAIYNTSIFELFLFTKNMQYPKDQLDNQHLTKESIAGIVFKFIDLALPRPREVVSSLEYTDVKLIKKKELLVHILLYLKGQNITLYDTLLAHPQFGTQLVGTMATFANSSTLENFKSLEQIVILFVLGSQNAALTDI